MRAIINLILASLVYGTVGYMDQVDGDIGRGVIQLLIIVILIGLINIKPILKSLYRYSLHR